MVLLNQREFVKSKDVKSTSVSELLQPFREINLGLLLRKTGKEFFFILIILPSKFRLYNIPAGWGTLNISFCVK
jgi:hypothetical protein